MLTTNDPIAIRCAKLVEAAARAKGTVSCFPAGDFTSSNTPGPICLALRGLVKDLDTLARKFEERMPPSQFAGLDRALFEQLLRFKAPRADELVIEAFIAATSVPLGISPIAVFRQELAARQIAVMIDPDAPTT